MTVRFLKSGIFLKPALCQNLKLVGIGHALIFWSVIQQNYAHTYCAIFLCLLKYWPSTFISIAILYLPVHWSLHFACLTLRTKVEKNTQNSSAWNERCVCATDSKCFRPDFCPRNRMSLVFKDFADDVYHISCIVNFLYLVTNHSALCIMIKRIEFEWNLWW